MDINTAGSESVSTLQIEPRTHIDNVFMKARRMHSALERPVSTSSSHNRVWHGYAPYNPAMLEIYLTLFRVASNFIHVGDDGRTPAMRLGFAKEPLRYEDILWPGEQVPRPRAERRRGASWRCQSESHGGRPDPRHRAGGWRLGNVTSCGSTLARSRIRNGADMCARPPSQLA